LYVPSYVVQHVTLSTFKVLRTLDQKYGKRNMAGFWLEEIKGEHLIPMSNCWNIPLRKMESLNSLEMSEFRSEFGK